MVCFSLFFLLLTSSPQTPFTFGLNQRAPYTAGDRCLLCRCERKDGAVPSEAGITGQNGTSQPNKTPSALQLPLWVCSDCRRTVEKEDRHTALEQSLGVSHECITFFFFSMMLLKFVAVVKGLLCFRVFVWFHCSHVCVCIDATYLQFNSHSCGQSLRGWSSSCSARKARTDGATRSNSCFSEKMLQRTDYQLIFLLGFTLKYS